MTIIDLSSPGDRELVKSLPCGLLSRDGISNGYQTLKGNVVPCPREYMRNISLWFFEVWLHWDINMYVNKKTGCLVPYVR